MFISVITVCVFYWTIDKNVKLFDYSAGKCLNKATMLKTK